MPRVSGALPLKKGFVDAKRLIAILCLSALTLVVTPTVGAQVADSPDFFVAPSALALRGFGTLGVARSTDEGGYLRDISQIKGVDSNWSAKNDSIFGVQANYRIGNDLDAAVQVASYYRYDETFSPDLTWAYLKYEPTPSLTFRVGRIGTEFLVNSDSSRIGYSYLPVRPAPEFFGGLVVNYGDGADMQIRHPLGEGVFFAKLLAGRATEKMPLYSLGGSRLIKGALGYTVGPWQLNFIHARVRFSDDVPGFDDLRSALNGFGAVAASNALGLEGAETRYQSFGIAYDNGTWMVQGFVNSLKHEFVVFENSRSAYAIAARRWGSVTPYIGYARGKSTSKKLDGVPAPLSASVTDLLAATHGSQHRTTLGVRWDFAKNMDMKAQVDFVSGDKASRVMFDSTHSEEWSGRGTIFSLSIDFIF